LKNSVHLWITTVYSLILLLGLFIKGNGNETSR
jgi:hypothetical protein